MVSGTSEKSATNSRFPKMHGDNYMYVEAVLGSYNSVCKERGVGEK